jgi:mono/diheme cytochrome c family protein
VQSLPTQPASAPLSQTGNQQQSAQKLVDYDTQVHAIIAQHCLICHSAALKSGGLSLETYDGLITGGRTGPAVVPGHGKESLIVQHLTGEVLPQMPNGMPPLADDDIATIRLWIDQGARRSSTAAALKTGWVPTLALTAPGVPAPTWNDWSSPIDRFTAAYLGAQGLPEPRLVSDAVFARRAYLDVWGLLPTPEQMKEFETDKRPDKRKRLVSALLADDTKYADNWISYWNDLLRNDEGVVYYSETANRKTITPWLLDSLKTNRPYNQWIDELLDPKKAGDPEGFLIGVNWRGTVSASQTPALQAAQNSAQIFLGINLKCNSCHDNFVGKPWKLTDSYGLAAYFSDQQKLQLYRCDIAQNGKFVTASFLYPQLNRQPASDSPEDRRAAAAAVFTDPRNGRMPRTLVNRIWAKLMGHGLTADVDDMDGKPWSPELLDWMASDFASNNYDLKHLIGIILTSRTYQMPAVSVPENAPAPREYVFKGPELRRLTAEQFDDAVAAITGDWLVSNSGGIGKAGAAAASASGITLSVSGSPVDGADLPAAAPAAVVAPAAQPARSRPPQAAPPVAFPSISAGEYVRAWRMAADSLSKAMGRPIRDQVFSTRDEEATTVQALELTNGQELNHWLWRGSRRLLGELPAEPRSLFSRQIGSGQNAIASAASPFDVDVSKSQKLYLIVTDSLSTAPGKATPLWLHASFSNSAGATTPLSALKPENPADLRDDSGPIVPAGATTPALDAVRAKFPSVLTYDIAGKGFTRFQGAPAFEEVQYTQGESVIARFFVFDEQPSMDRLVPPNPGTPLPSEPTLKTIPQAVDYVYWYTLGRAPSPAERQIAEAALRDPHEPGHPSADGLADLLWSIIMTPEFQLIR